MAEPIATPRRRRGSLLTSYYGGTTDASGAPAEASVDPLDDMNIDTDGFNAPKYVGSLLQYKSLEQLVGRGNSMVSEIKSLDSDMQMLVYENYSKFISATDTIQEMKERVDGMEGAMKALEDNFGYISRASEAVSSSFSARRGELERLNTVKKTLKKLQFLMDLPARLQDCIAEGELALAVRCHAKAVKIMAAAGKHAAGFDGIRSECEQIMARLSSSLHERLEDEFLPPDALCETVWLLLRLGGREDSLLPTFLERRRKALTTAINAFTPAVAADAAADAEGAADAAEGDAAEAPEAPEAGEGGGAGGRGEGLSPARAPTRSVTAEHTRQLGSLVVPQLLELVAAWRDKFGGEGGGGEASRERKEGMLAECVGEVCGALLEAVRQLMSEEPVPSEELLEGCGELLDAIAPLHEETLRRQGCAAVHTGA